MNRQGPHQPPPQTGMRGLQQPQNFGPAPASSSRTGSLPNGKLGWTQTAPPPGVSAPRTAGGVSFSSALGSNSTPFSDIDFPTLGQQQGGQTAQGAWTGAGRLQGGESEQDFPSLPRGGGFGGGIGGGPLSAAPFMSGSVAEDKKTRSIINGGAPGLAPAPGLQQNLAQQAQQNPHGSTISPAPGLSGPAARPPHQPPQKLPPGVGMGAAGAISMSISNSDPALNGTPITGGESSASVSASITNYVNGLGQFGLDHLARTLKYPDTDEGQMAVGTDLQALGLNLGGPDSPLYQTFASPFADDARPVEPEFRLPQCYTVQNTPKVEDRIQSFTDETLFYIFYDSPQDLMQLNVVMELSARNWRFHKALGLWMTKFPDAQIQSLTPDSERGEYIFFDPMLWETVKKEIVLYYRDLDPRTTQQHQQSHLAMQSIPPLNGVGFA